MVGFLTCQTIIFCTNVLSTHEFEDSDTMQSAPNRTFKQTNLIKSTAVTGVVNSFNSPYTLLRRGLLSTEKPNHIESGQTLHC